MLPEVPRVRVFRALRAGLQAAFASRPLASLQTFRVTGVLVASVRFLQLLHSPGVKKSEYFLEKVFNSLT